MNEIEILEIVKKLMCKTNLREKINLFLEKKGDCDQFCFDKAIEPIDGKEILSLPTGYISLKIPLQVIIKKQDSMAIVYTMYGIKKLNHILVLMEPHCDIYFEIIDSFKEHYFIIQDSYKKFMGYRCWIYVK